MYLSIRPVADWLIGCLVCFSCCCRRLISRRWRILWMMMRRLLLLIFIQGVQTTPTTTTMTTTTRKVLIKSSLLFKFQLIPCSRFDKIDQKCRTSSSSSVILLLLLHTSAATINTSSSEESLLYMCGFKWNVKLLWYAMLIEFHAPITIGFRVSSEPVNYLPIASTSSINEFKEL